MKYQQIHRVCLRYIHISPPFVTMVPPGHSFGTYTGLGSVRPGISHGVRTFVFTSYPQTEARKFPYILVISREFCQERYICPAGCLSSFSLHQMRAIFLFASDRHAVPNPLNKEKRENLDPKTAPQSPVGRTLKSTNPETTHRAKREVWVGPKHFFAPSRLESC